MFDNVPQKSAQQAPQDMFDSVERAPSAPPAPPMPQMIAPPPSALQPPAMPSPVPSMPEDSGMGAGKMILILVVSLLVLGGSGALAYWFMMQPASNGVVDAVPSDNVIANDEDADTATDNTETSTSPEPTEQVSPATLLDSDGDGLMNSEELEAGTSITKADTDGDGLGDREEVQVYDTDPKDPDTDGDGYLDGQEVAGGYNPNGEGRLFTVPEQGSGS